MTKSSFERAFPDCEIVEATEDMSLTFLGNDRNLRRAIKAGKVPGATKVIRQYPSGEEAFMGYATINGGAVAPDGPIYFTGPTEDFNDPRNVTPNGRIEATPENAARFVPATGTRQ